MKLLPLLCLLSPWVGCTATQQIRSRVVTVSEDEEALLPCALGFEQSIDKFDWKKDNGEGEKKEVFFYDRGSHYGNGLQGQNEQYKDRVVFFQHEIKSGNASIIIKNTHLEDNGTYTCVLLEPYRQEVNIRLNVGAARVPYIQTIHDQITWRLLECKAQGVPKPQMEWRNSAGKIPYVHEISDPKSKYKNILQVNVSRSDNYTCVATQRDIFHQINNTLGVSIPDSVSVSEGDDALLPCSLDSKENIESLEFSWRKDDDDVFSYDSGRVKEHELFTGRLTYFQHELKSGNASIRIHNTQKSDSGRFSCHFPNSQKSHVILQVVGKKADPGALTGWIVAGFLGVVLFLLIMSLIIRSFCKSANRRNQTGQASGNESKRLNDI